MVELQQGTLVEKRRGGSAILSTLVSDMIENSTNGYIRCERTPKDDVPKVGQLVIFNREIVAAFYESKRPQYGTKAVKNIESDCQELDCIIQVITGIDIARLLDIYPEAKIKSDSDKSGNNQKWWQNLSNRENTWIRSRRSENADDVDGTPEYIKIKSNIFEHNYTSSAEILRPGSVFSNGSDSLYNLASNLAALGRPLLIISRIAKRELFENIGIDEKTCLWLSRQEGERNILPEIDGITNVVSEFLSKNIRAVMLFDGLEYLSSICGSNQVINLIRDLADMMRYEDDCLLIHTSDTTWSKKEYTQIVKAAPSIDTQTIDDWNIEPEMLEDHPLLAPLTEEEISQMEEYISENTPKQAIEENISEIDLEEETIEELVEIIEEPIIEEDIVEVQPVQPEEFVHNKGPRTAQVVKRKRPRKTTQNQNVISQKSRLSAAVGKEIKSEFPQTQGIPKTVIGHGRTGKLPEIPSVIPNSLDDVVKQKSSTKDLDLPKPKPSSKTINLVKGETSEKQVLSPVAARGIEVKKNVNNRSQASSRPQRKLDLDGRLRSWKEEVE